MNIVAGTVAILVMEGVYSRSKVVIRSIFVSLPCLMVVAFSLFAYSEADVLPSVVAALASGPLSIVGFTILLPVFEGIFKKVSCFKYAELTDHKAKFIKKMIEQAPGTFNHAVIVANIAENCATAIGEDSMLARTCAYYHDVGKLRRPEFFKENQAGIEDPHEGLTPELSCNIIRSHAQDGYDLLIKNRFPKQIADACAQHHGTLPIYYFYDKAKKFTDGEVVLEQFCYLGPKPQSKIAAILMIADSSEAATRTLSDRSREKVSEVVRNIVNERMKLGQFDECEITLKEITLIINAVNNSLTGIYHSRVEYPKVTLDGFYKDVVKED
jgi:putative nucleotidyltransferase with HDIG domain